jgi:hypothetical protein|tara:strand:- start:149 stop:490 length:342 start_codon:yes stop_codon:yes gene_type:complete
MSIDFDNQAGRENYLNEKLDNLLSGINATYGQVLLEELMIRLQRTITDFNEEVQSIMDDLKVSSERRSHLIHDLMEGKDLSPSKTDSDEPDESDVSSDDAPEMSEWEKRLEGK